jgi:hypothetical protein
VPPAAAFAVAGAAVTVADLDERGARTVAEPLGGTAVSAVRPVDILRQRRLLPARRRLDGPINSKSFFRTTSGDFVAETVSKMLG